MTTHVVVVGGGVTGLTTAYRLLEQGEGRLRVTLLEATDRLGGNVNTVREGGLVLDGGPDAFVIQKPQAAALCRDLGLADRLVETQVANRKVYIGRGDTLHVLPEGVVLTVPTRILPLARSPLFSWPGKLRMGFDLVRPPRRDHADESIASFVRRRLGDEALERLAEPLMGGIYAGDCERLSIQATFPQLADLEEKYGSLVKGVLATRPARKPGAPAPSAFYSLKGGMGELTDTLAAAVRERGGDVHTGFAVRALDRGMAAGARLRVVADSRAGAALALDADHVVLATPAHAAARALGELAPPLAAELEAIPYLSTATLLLAYDRRDVPHPMDAVGVLLPKGMGRRILAITFVTSKWEARAPEGTVVLRVFFGGFRREPDAVLPDDELVRIARDELRAVLGVVAEPRMTRAFHYPKSNPQPVVGHKERLARLRTLGGEVPGLHLGGAAYDGVGLPDCVRQAEQLAARILDEAR
jgi:oxygen-dependent protoporphyrinogen oxidase